MKNIIFVHKEFYHKIQVSVKEQMVFCRKIALNNFAIVTKKNTCVGVYIFNKNAGLQAYNFIKKRLQQICFLVNIAKSLRTPILKGIWERLLLRVFPFMLGWTFSYMNKWHNKVHRRQRRRFLKNKSKKSFQKTTTWKKLALSWFPLSFRFSLFLHCMSSGVFPTS